VRDQAWQRRLMRVFALLRRDAGRDRQQKTWRKSIIYVAN
jgi:hypothetical protein